MKPDTYFIAALVCAVEGASATATTVCAVVMTILYIWSDRRANISSNATAGSE